MVNWPLTALDLSFCLPPDLIINFCFLNTVCIWVFPEVWYLCSIQHCFLPLNLSDSVGLIGFHHLSGGRDSRMSAVVKPDGAKGHDGWWSINPHWQITSVCPQGRGWFMQRSAKGACYSSTTGKSNFHTETIRVCREDSMSRLVDASLNCCHSQHCCSPFLWRGTGKKITMGNMTSPNISLCWQCHMFGRQGAAFPNESVEQWENSAKEVAWQFCTSRKFHPVCCHSQRLALLLSDTRE